MARRLVLGAHAGIVAVVTAIGNAILRKAATLTGLAVALPDDLVGNGVKLDRIGNTVALVDGSLILGLVLVIEDGLVPVGSTKNDEVRHASSATGDTSSVSVQGLLIGLTVSIVVVVRGLGVPWDLSSIFLFGFPGVDKAPLRSVVGTGDVVGDRRRHGLNSSRHFVCVEQLPRTVQLRLGKLPYLQVGDSHVGEPVDLLRPRKGVRDVMIVTRAVCLVFDVNGAILGWDVMVRAIVHVTGDRGEGSSVGAAGVCTGHIFTVELHDKLRTARGEVLIIAAAILIPGSLKVNPRARVSEGGSASHRIELLTGATAGRRNSALFQLGVGALVFGIVVRFILWSGHNGGVVILGDTLQAHL